MGSKTFKFLVEVTTVDEDVVLNRGYFSSAAAFKKNMIKKIMQAVATYPDLVCIDVDEYEPEEATETTITIYMDDKLAPFRMDNQDILKNAIKCTK